MIEITALIFPFVVLALILVFVGLVAFILTREVEDAIGIVVVVGVIGLICIGIVFLISLFFGFPIPQAQIFKMV